MTDTAAPPARADVADAPAYQWYAAGQWRDAPEGRLFDDFEPFAGGTAVFPHWQGQDDRVCSFGGIGSGGRGRARGEHVDGEPDRGRVARAGDEHAVAGSYG